MKNKLILPVIIILFGFNAMAQTSDPVQPPMGRATFGIYGGVNFQNINGKDISGNKLQNSMITKFHVGINEQIPVAPEFFVQVGLQYIGKGGRGNVMYSTVTEIREIDMNYIELPINLLYKPLVGKGHFLLGFGPYVGYAINGKAKFTGEKYNATESVNFEKTINQQNPNDLGYFKHLDVGANGFFGYEFSSNLNIVFDAQLGLVNINSKNTFYPNSKLAEMNTGFGLSLGYRF